MATKTLILRPVKVTCDDETLVTFYPDTAALSTAHMLVNEEVADDDSTYVLASAGSNVYYHFNYVKPSDLKNINSFTFYVKIKAETAGSNSNYNNINYSINLSSQYTLPSSKLGTEAGYIIHSGAGNSDDITANIIQEFNDTTSDLNFYITQNVASGGKNNPIRTTQIYVEIIYEPEDIIYIRSNDVWDITEYTELYFKNNVEWVKLESPAESVFDDGSKYKIKEVD